MCTCYILLNKPHNRHCGKRKMYKKNCGCKLIKTCQFSSSQHEGMYFTAKEIYTRTTNLSSFYGTSCRFINNSLPRIFFLNINSNRISVDIFVSVSLCVLSIVVENFKNRDLLISAETISKLVKLEFKRTARMREH